MTAYFLTAEEQTAIKVIQLRLEQASPIARAKLCAIAVLASQNQPYQPLLEAGSNDAAWQSFYNVIQNDLPVLSPQAWLKLATQLVSSFQPLTNQPPNARAAAPNPLFATTPQE